MSEKNSGTHNIGNVPVNKVPDDLVAVIREEYLRGDPVMIIASRSGVSHGSISHLCKGLVPSTRLGALPNEVIADLLAGWRAA